jgi:hypothetical protein
MKENSTLNLLTRKVEFKLKEAQVQVGKIEKILLERLSAENQIISKLNSLNAQILEIKKRDRQLFLSGSKNILCKEEDSVVFELEKLKVKLQLVQSERVMAEGRLRAAQNELMIIQREKEGLMKVVDAKLVDAERVNIEKSESN